MIILTKFLGLHPTLPLAELEAVFQAEKIDYWLIETFENYAVHGVKKFKPKKLGERLALTHAIFEILSDITSADAEQLVEKAKIKGIRLPYTVKIEKIGKGMDIDYQRFLKEVADEVWRKLEKDGIKPSVDLNNPATEFWVFVGEDFVILTRKLVEVDKKQFTERAPPNRPFFLPISMDPRIARAIVNLTRIKRGKKFLDPCCGSGGLLLEAASIGCRVYGVDIDEKMVEGSVRNLKHYGFYGSVKKGDCRKLEKIFNKRNYFDGIATDFPYGRSTRKQNAKMYEECLKSMERVLKPLSYMVIVAHEEIRPKSKNLILVELHRQRVHRNLVRYIHVFRKMKK
ncbi:MAG: methyltransferase domain-containing protein [Candidatus Aenigmarchaeota archaeon]|nr:methyltransferase domain-containing protein [Candidatus Aenigmarchaeota archaeon]